VRQFLFLQQLLVLETNLFLGGFSFHDQHRDMRLDIDNLTYEVRPCICIKIRACFLAAFGSLVCCGDNPSYHEVFILLLYVTCIIQ